MKTFSLLLVLSLPVCLGCGQKPASTSQKEEPISQGKSLGERARSATDADLAQEKANAQRKKTIVFNKTEYLHRWSQKGQHEFTPSGQEDLSKWTDMMTINVYEDVVDGDGLALLANKVLENYKSHGGIVLKTDSVPRTVEKPAEHLIAVILGQPTVIEVVQARFKLIDKKGVAIIHSHRVYGSSAGPEMSDWLKKNGPSMEEELMKWESVNTAFIDSLKDKDGQAR